MHKMLAAIALITSIAPACADEVITRILSIERLDNRPGRPCFLIKPNVTPEENREWCDAIWVSVNLVNPTPFLLKVSTECTIYDKASRVIGRGATYPEYPLDVAPNRMENYVGLNGVRIPKIRLDDIGNVICKSEGKRS